MTPSICLAASCLAISAFALRTTAARTFLEDATSLLQVQVSSRGASQEKEALVPAFLPAIHIASAAARSEPALDVASAAFKNKNIANIAPPPKWEPKTQPAWVGNAVGLDLEETEKVSHKIDDDFNMSSGLEEGIQGEDERLEEAFEEETEQDSNGTSQKDDDYGNMTRSERFSALEQAADNVLKGLEEEKAKRERAWMNATLNGSLNGTGNSSIPLAVYPPPGELYFSYFPAYYYLVQGNFWKLYWAWRHEMSHQGSPRVNQQIHFDTEVRDLEVQASYAEQLGDKKKAMALRQKACLIQHWLFQATYPWKYKLRKTCNGYNECILHPQQEEWFNLQRENHDHQAYEKSQWRLSHPKTFAPAEHWPTWWTDFLPWNTWNHWVGEWNKHMKQVKEEEEEKFDPPWVQPKTTTPFFPAQPQWCKIFPGMHSVKQGKPGIPGPDVGWPEPFGFTIR